MTPTEYLVASARTENTPDFIQLRAGALTDSLAEQRFNAGLMHAAMGIVTEAGEFIDVLKKLTIYSKPVDRVNLVEELGDIAWYIALACRTLGVSLEEVMDRNISKLTTRFPEKFTEAAAMNRNLDAERAALEGK